MVDLRLPRPSNAVDELPRPGFSGADVQRSGMALVTGVVDFNEGLEAVGVEVA
jgi:hypothetical protein